LQNSPDWQAQVPLLQAWPFEQGIPHPPQLLGSRRTSAQLSPHRICPALHGLGEPPPDPVVPPVPADPLLPELAHPATNSAKAIAAMLPLRSVMATNGSVGMP
jgi:hypothetical protein